MASMTFDTPKTLSTEDHHQSLLSRATAVFVFLFEKVMPDPYVFAVLLTSRIWVMAFDAGGTP